MNNENKKSKKCMRCKKYKDEGKFFVEADKSIKVCGDCKKTMTWNNKKRFK